MPDLKTIQGVEIFSVGKWNGDTYSESDLDEMVQAFKDTSATCKPALKLGHTTDQKLIQKDGLPAAGWVGNVYRKGGKLIADFIDIPAKIYDLIERKAYRNVSSEIYWGIDINGKKYNRMLAGVALLGAEMPAVSNLSDILSMYGIGELAPIKRYASESDNITIKQYNFEKEGEGKMPNKSEAELKLEQELKDAQANAEAKAKEYAAQAKAKEDALQAEIAELKKFKADAEAKAIEEAAKAAEAKLESDVSLMVSEKLITPAMKPYIKELLGAEKKEYSFQAKTGEEKLDKKSLIEKILKLHSVVDSVNLEEGSEHSYAAANVSEATEKKIKKFMEDNKCSYSKAYRAVMKEKAE